VLTDQIADKLSQRLTTPFAEEAFAEGGEGSITEVM